MGLRIGLARLISGCLPFIFLVGSAATAATTTLKDSPKALVDEAWQFINKNYIDPQFNQVDWSSIRSELLARQYGDRQQAYRAIQQTLTKLNDPYTRFLPPQEYGQLLRQTQGQLVDVGLTLAEMGETFQVAAITSDSIAAKADLKVGDEIVAINGRGSDRLTLERATYLLRGTAGTKLVLSVRRGEGDIFAVEITREGEIPTTVLYQVIVVGSNRIGYIRLNGFNSHSKEQMETAITTLAEQNVQSYILDLRHNPGGLLEAGIDITRQWLPSGVIVRIQQGEKEDEIRANQRAITDLPLVVLVNQASASASEILAGALQDHGRAQVVGTRTFGKVRVQAVHEMGDGSALVVTVARYLTPKGTDISEGGITPDVVVSSHPATDMQLRINPHAIASGEDPVLLRALEVLITQQRSSR